MSDVAQGWKEDLQSNQPDWAKGLPTLGQVGSSPRQGAGGDPLSFDDWQGGMERRWGEAYKDTVHSSFEKRKKKSANPYGGGSLRVPGSGKKKSIDRYTESYEGISEGVGAGGWNTSTSMNVTQKPQIGEQGINAEAALAAMKRDLLIAQLQAQRNNLERKQKRAY